MTSVRLPSLRHLIARPTKFTRWAQQRRWARVLDVRFVATQNTQDRIVDRYKHLLEEKAKREGLKDVGQLKEVYRDKILSLRKKAVVPGATGPLPQQAQQKLPAPSARQAQSPWPSPPPVPSVYEDVTAESPHKPRTSSVKTLPSFIDVQKTMDLPQKEIESIWRLRHAHSEQSLCAAIPTALFSAIYETARKHPYFILPGLPRKQTMDAQKPDAEPQEGAPIHFMQWTFPGPDTVTVLFTHLAEYKLRGEYAQPHTTMTHHLELSQPKGLVLCQGSVVPDRGVSVEEGKWLVLCMQKFYNTHNTTEIEAELDSDVGKALRKKRRQLIEQFSRGDSNFKIEELLDQAERLG